MSGRKTKRRVRDIVWNLVVMVHFKSIRALLLDDRIVDKRIFMIVRLALFQRLLIQSERSYSLLFFLNFDLSLVVRDWFIGGCVLYLYQELLMGGGTAGLRPCVSCGNLFPH